MDKRNMDNDDNLKLIINYLDDTFKKIFIYSF